MSCLHIADILLIRVAKKTKNQRNGTTISSELELIVTVFQQSTTFSFLYMFTFIFVHFQCFFQSMRC